MTPVRWLLTIAGTIGVIAFINNTRDEPKAPAPPIDWAQPIFTKDRAIICPMSVLDDPRADRGPAAVRGLWSSVLNRSSKIKEMGCEEWRDGVPVSARIMFPEDKSSIVAINETLFTQQFDLRN